MSNRYKGAVISATPPTTSGGPSGTASGAWTLEQQMQLQAASLWPSQPPPPFIEDVFSCFLYTGTGATQTITNNIDLSTKGGLVWLKARGLNEGTYPQDHSLIDTVRGPTVALASNLTTGNLSQEYALGTSGTFNSNGFTIASTNPQVNGSAMTVGYVSWTFREQPKFFDVVTYTGTGSNTTIAHSLGSVPGSIIVKRTDTTAAWAVYHRSLANTQYLVLNTTAAAATGATWWNSTTPTSSVFSLGTDASVNASGGTYVAYIYAHDAGGFGLTETDNVISCGSFTGNTTVTLGYEPQWILLKNSGGVEDWYIHDTTRGWPVSGDAKVLYPNLSSAESATAQIFPNATGFSTSIGGGTYIYIAIRRGPMQVPTLGTSVFNPNTSYSTISAGKFGVTTGFPVDALLWRITAATSANYENGLMARLTGGRDLKTYSTDVEAANILGTFDYSTQVAQQAVSTGSQIYLSFRRAPSFFDVVCYTGNGGNMTISHNLGVVPTLMIVRGRNATGAGQWKVYDGFDGNDNYMALNTTAATASGYGAYWNTTTPTSTVFYVGSNNTTNTGTYVAYLFATCAGVSKVGSYTGTGTTLQINCGFTGGARFVLIKRTDSTGDWYVWDSARGIIAGNDPYLLLNSTAAEVTGTDYIDTYSAGFEISSTAPAAINANGGTYIFLAIA